MFLRKAIENPVHVAQTITSDLYLSQIYDNIYRKFHSITESKGKSSPRILEIGGGALNCVVGSAATIGGGVSNLIDASCCGSCASFATIGGGCSNNDST